MTTTLTPAEPRTRPGAGLRGLAWLTWRQHRWFFVGTLIATVAVVAVVLWFTTGLHEIVSVMDSTRCDQGGQARCPQDLVAKRDFYDRFLLVPLWYAPVVLTVVVAVFVGAPLVTREYEQETHLLAWSQGVSPVRWILSKTGLLAAAAAVFALVFGVAANSLMSAYRSIPQTFQPTSPWDYQYYEASPLLVIGYTLFGLALGLAAGALLRRTLPAMAGTLIAFAAVRWVVSELRPYFLPPERFLQLVTTAPKTVPNWGHPFDPLITYQGFADVAGNKLGTMEQACPLPTSQLSTSNWTVWRSSYVSCLHSHGAVNYLDMAQPANRLPTFQLIETGIFLVLAAILFVIAGRRVRSRTTI